MAETKKQYLSDEAREALYPDPEKQKIQRKKDVYAAASNGGVIPQTPYELASGAKMPTPQATAGAVQVKSTPGTPLVVTVGAPVEKKAVPAKPLGQTPFIADRSMSGNERFDKTKLTLGNTPSGKVGMFKDGEMLDPSKTRLSGGNLGGTPLPVGQSPFFMKSQAAQGLVPQAGTASAIPGMQQNPAVTTPGGNMTGIMNQETAMLSAALGQNMKPGQYQDFSKSIGMNPSTPGGDAAFRSIEAQIADLTNMNKQLLGGYGQTTDMGRMSQGKRMAMVQKNSETIKGLNDSLTGRSTLANDLVKALIGAQTGEKTTAMTAAAGTEQERIKAGATMGSAAINADAAQGAAINKGLVKSRQDDRKISADSIGKLLAPLDKKYADGTLTDPKEIKEWESLRAQMARYAISDDDDDVDEKAPSFGS